MTGIPISREMYRKLVDGSWLDQCGSCLTRFRNLHCSSFLHQACLVFAFQRRDLRVPRPRTFSAAELREKRVGSDSRIRSRTSWFEGGLYVPRPEIALYVWRRER